MHVKSELSKGTFMEKRNEEAEKRRILTYHEGLRELKEKKQDEGGKK